MNLPERILQDFSTFAVVGASRNASKAAHIVPAKLQAAGFRIVPVNPNASGQLLGTTVYPSLAAIPFPVEVVVLFRPSSDAPPLAREAAAIGAQALWLQLGITSLSARKIAEEAGMLYVEDRCTAVERALRGIRK